MRGGKAEIADECLIQRPVDPCVRVPCTAACKSDSNSARSHKITERTPDDRVHVVGRLGWVGFKMEWGSLAGKWLGRVDDRLHGDLGTRGRCRNRPDHILATAIGHEVDPTILAPVGLHVAEVAGGQRCLT